MNGWSIVEERLARGKGLIVVTGHLGNWELGGAYLAARGLPIDAVARHMENPLFDRYLTRDAPAHRHDRRPRRRRRAPRAALAARRAAPSRFSSIRARSVSRRRGCRSSAGTRRRRAVRRCSRCGSARRSCSASRCASRSGRYQLDFEPIDVVDDRRSRGRRRPHRRRLHGDARALGPARARSNISGIIVAGSISGPDTPPELGDPSMSRRDASDLRSRSSAPGSAAASIVLLVLLAIAAPLVRAPRSASASISSTQLQPPSLAALVRHRHPGPRRLGAARLRRARLALGRHRLAGHRAHARRHRSGSSPATTATGSTSS